MKGFLLNLGHEGRLFKGFKAFLPVEMISFIGLIALNDVTPRMRFMHEFNPLAGNDLRVRIFEENATRRCREFKICFSLVDSRVAPPLKKLLPNCKVQDFLNHMHDVNHETWVPGKTF